MAEEKTARELIEQYRSIRLTRMSQGKLARLTGVKQPTIAQYEGGRYTPGLDMLLKLLKPLGYTLAIVPLNEEEAEHSEEETDEKTGV